ncbi:MAG TPA: protease pro-enzyme activation domain-containing protein [Xanthomonadaceae bacterium]|jgi:subtilase family serine protease
MTSTKASSAHHSGAAWKKTSLALAVMVAFCGGGALSASAAASVGSDRVAVARAVQLRNGDVVTGSLPTSQPMHVTVALKLRNRDALDAFVASMAKNRIGHVVTPPMGSAQIAANHLPTAQQAQAVADYLAGMGFRNVKIAPNRLLVTADGTAATAGNAFHTSFAQVRTHDGRMAFANIDEVRAPAALGGIVQSVLGMQNVHMAHTFARPVQRDAAHTLAITGHAPIEFPSIYGVGSSAAATSVAVGIITQGDMTQTLTDFQTFLGKNASLPQPFAPTVVAIDGACTPTSRHDKSCTSGVDEWDLDSQDIYAMSGGVSQLILYDIPQLTDDALTDGFNAAVTANVAKVINVSIGGCETDSLNDGAAATQDAIFEMGVAQGQTFSISTGDSGANECTTGTTPSWPAASQYVVAAAGTTLNASTTTWSSETVWSGSGGSPSKFEPQPTWQAGFVPAGVTTRDVADIAFDADPNSGSKVYVNSTTTTTQIGGTSLSAPLFAGTWARVLQQYPTIGFAAPVIYSLPAADFHDITSGNNGGETAGVGYDSASGRGSMIVAAVIADSVGLGNQSPVVSFSWVRTGQTIAFTDTSTDEGAGATHSWNFADGTTSTAANPTHSYAVAGTYFVKETVTNPGGASATKGYTVKPAPIQELKDGGFEAGSTAWTISPTTARTNDSSQAHAGSWYVALGGVTGEKTHHIQQGVTLPASAASATLSFYVDITTAETTTTAANDVLSVQVTDTSGNLLATLATYSNLDATDGYALKSLDMTPYVGQTVRVKFLATNNGSLPTTWAIDDVSVAVP